MEKRGSVGCVLMVVCVFMGMLITQTTSSAASSFKDCYKGCFILCVITPGTSLYSCATKCFKDCIFPSPSNYLQSKNGGHGNPNSNININNHYFCKLGCASSLCSNLSSKDDPCEEKVGSCVDSCSDKCAKNYSP